MQKDDMPALLDKMLESDIWVLGTPIYWWGPTAQFKAFLDRWYLPTHQEFKGKRVIIVIPLEGENERYARHAVGLFEDVFDYLQMVLVDKIVAPGFNKRGEVRNNETLMNQAREMGKKIIQNK